ncbi:MAG TPA: hypothetical protein VHK67_01380 [Rhabdochlamydiaceae bacterium]|jgi:hypothetical protein|nr:hypothetical protein [Rhabdochlamydiaceae bacterium]
MATQISEAALIALFQTGFTYGSGRAYDAARDQAIIFSGLNAIVEGVLVFFVTLHISNTRGMALAAVLIKTIAGIAGMAATRIVCEKMIALKQAVARVAISNFATRWSIQFLLTPVPIPKINA